MGKVLLPGPGQVQAKQMYFGQLMCLHLGCGGPKKEQDMALELGEAKN